MNSGATTPRLVNRLDDFALGGATQRLGISDSEIVLAVVEPKLFAVGSDAMIASRLDADVIVTNSPPNWRRILFLASVPMRNPHARIPHVGRSCTRVREALKVRAKHRFFWGG
jgi:hypothetical protein